MKRSVTLISGAAIIVVLVGVLVLVKNLPKKSAPLPPTITLAQLPTDKIEQIVLKNHGETVTLKQVNKKWVVEYPAKLEWDNTSIQAVVNSFTSLSAVREVEKNPTDLAQFGLNPPGATAVATLTDGSKVQIDIGTKTPTNSGYYVMKAGDKPLYIAATYSVSPLLSTINSLRNKQLPSINTTNLTYMRLTENGTTIEIQPMPPNSPLQTVSFSNLEMVKPYPVPHAVDTSKLDAALKAFPSYLTIHDFVTDHPTDLASYGLAPPQATLVMKDNKNTLDIELGNKLPNGYMYAKLAGQPTVFTVNYSDFQTVLQLTPFDVVDKFLMIPNIASVDSLTIKTPQETYNAVINRVVEKGAKPDSTGKIPTTDQYSLNGKSVKSSDFKSFYQDVIGLLADSPNPNPNIPFNPEIAITFNVNKGPQRTYEEYLVPYNRLFYAVFINGSSFLLLDRGQVKKMLGAAQDVLAGKKPPT